MIADIDAFIDGLRFGSDELSLVRRNNDAFQSKMQELDDYFQHSSRRSTACGGSNNTDIIPSAKPFSVSATMRPVWQRRTHSAGLAFRSGEYITADIRHAHAADRLPAVSGAARLR